MNGSKATTLKDMLAKHLADEKARAEVKMRAALYTSDPDHLAMELAKLEAERLAVEKFKAAEEKARADMAKLEKIRIEREAEAIQLAQKAAEETQQSAAQEAFIWMQVFNALEKRGMEPNECMNAIKSFQDMGHTAELCLELIERTAVKPKAPAEPKKEAPRPAAYGTWA